MVTALTVVLPVVPGNEVVAVEVGVMTEITGTVDVTVETVVYVSTVVLPPTVFVVVTGQVVTYVVSVL